MLVRPSALVRGARGLWSGWNGIPYGARSHLTLTRALNFGSLCGPRVSQAGGSVIALSPYLALPDRQVTHGK